MFKVLRYKRIHIIIKKEARIGLSSPPTPLRKGEGSNLSIMASEIKINKLHIHEKL